MKINSFIKILIRLFIIIIILECGFLFLVPFDKFNIKNKNTHNAFIESEKIYLKISVLPLILKKINLKDISADNLSLYLVRNADGSFNFNELFPQKNKQVFKIQYNNSNIDLKKLKISAEA